LFHGVWTFGVKVIEFQKFLMNHVMNQKIELNDQLFWKIHKFCITSPNTTKPSSWNPLCIELSICTNFMAFEPLVSKLLNFKGFITN